MTPREKTLAALVGAIVVLLGIRSVHNRAGEAYRDYTNQELALQDALTTEELKVAAGLEAAGKLTAWREKSLPPDPTDANLQYQSWLSRELDDAGLEFSIQEPISILARPDGNLITCKVSAEGDLEEVTDFLYAFYRANHLHKLSKINFEPDEAGLLIGLEMTIEAWALHDSFNADGLAEGESSRLAYDSLDKYHELIVNRNIFKPYEPPRPAAEQTVEKREPPFDHAEHARATGIVSSNGNAKVWIYVRTTGDKYWLNEGETFKVGDLECRIVKIDEQKNSFVFEAEGQQYSVKIGSSLREGQLVSTEQAT
jgi:hypothetical protein